ncbi:hypothetical protein HY041_03355 [Candidatus Roizmanbacteria bacterium]|nr:hypothetical protein [Candidatus Roizmanbacteria bacterium]
MIGKIASDLFDIVAQCHEGPADGDMKLIHKYLKQMQENLPEIQDEEFHYYASDFVEKWLAPGAIENDFEVFAAETNEITVEFGNEGFFNDIDEEE